MSDWHRQMLGMPWEETDLQKALRGLAERYHRVTEAYDRQVCTGPIIGGSIIPACPEERRLITRNADRVRATLWESAAAMGCTRADWHTAIISVRLRGKDIHR